MTAPLPPPGSRPPDPPAGGGLPPAPEPPQGEPRPAPANLFAQYTAAGGVRPAEPGTLRLLPAAVDDVQQRYGDTPYTTMQADPVVDAALSAFVGGALAPPWHVRPSVDDKEAPDYPEAKGYADFIDYCLGNVRCLPDALEQHLRGACAYGSKVAEVVVTPSDSPKWPGWLCVDRWPLKPRTAVGYVLDPFGNLVGVQAASPGGSNVPAQGRSGVPGDFEGVLPPEKFLILTWRGEGGDPRGRSMLRAAHGDWSDKLQCRQRLLRFLLRFANPDILGTAPGQPAQELDDSGTPTGKVINPAKVWMDRLVTMQEQGIAVGGEGYTAQLIQAQGEGRPFLNALDYYDRRITLAILTAERLTMEAKRSSQADAASAQDVVGLGFKRAQALVADLLTGLARRLILWNRGPAAARLAPYVTFAGTEQQDFAKDAIAWAELGFRPDVSQYPHIWEKLGLPPAAEGWQDRAAARAAPMGGGGAPAGNSQKQAAPGQPPPRQGG